MDYESPNEIESRRHRRPSSNAMFIVRNILNTLFIIGAIVGIVLTLKGQRLAGTYVVCAAMVLKFAESAIRLLKL